MSLIVLTWCIDRWRSDVTFGTAGRGWSEWDQSLWNRQRSVSNYHRWATFRLYLRTKCSKHLRVNYCTSGTGNIVWVPNEQPTRK